MKLKLTTLVGILLSLIAISLSVAQGTCPMIVEQALASMGENCEGLGRNSVCYGYNLVSAEFTETVSDDFFTLPADTAQLDILESIKTAEMSPDLSQWGVAVMNLQANIPNSMPGQSVKFVLMGDVEVESAVEPESVFQNAEAIEATLTNGVNIRSGAGLTFNVIGGATAGDTIAVDGFSSDGEWLRTVVNNRIGWIFAELVEPNEQLDELPVIDGTQRSLMQSFYLRTGFGSPACEEAPEDTLLVQGPQGIEVDLTVNGADIRIGSTITMRILPPGDIIEFTVVDGHLTIPGAGPDGEDITLFEGQRSTSCLGDPDDRGVDGNSNDRIVECDWSEPENVPPTDIGESFCAIQDVPDTLLNYSIDVQCPGEEPIQIIVNPDPPPAETEEPDDSNLCSAGNAWDDGRCDSDYWWQAGYYLGLYEEGEITLDEIPEDYRTPTEEPTAEPEEEKEKKKKFCQLDVGDGYYEVYKLPSFEYVDIVMGDPGHPECIER